MRIALLVVVLVLLLSPSLRSGAAASESLALYPTPAYPRASGTVQIERQGNRVTVGVNLRGLPTNLPPGQNRTSGDQVAPHYIVWLVDSERRLYNLGGLTATGSGDAASTFTPITVPPGTVTLAVSAEPRADLTIPSAPGQTVILSGQFVPGTVSSAHGLDNDFGPDWFAPIIPATLGLTLLRHAARTRRAELRARRHDTLGAVAGY
ncbi:MAG TPA: hypothetical protein VIL85_29550 [Thermomicrobiales bacterium]|jgi:hypothetical protein